MRDAFTYMFKDPGFGQKIIPFCIVNFIVLLMLGAPQLTNTSITTLTVSKVPNPFLHWFPFFGGVINFALLGYATVCVKAITQQPTNIVLPFFNFKNSILRGLRLFFATLPYTLSVLATFYVLVIGQAWLLLIALTLLIGIAVLVFFNSLFWVFANEERLSSFFALKKATRLLKNNAKSYFINLGIIVLINFLGTISSWIFMYAFNYIFNNPKLAWLTSSLEGSIIASYIAFVCMYLVAKSIKKESVV